MDDREATATLRTQMSNMCGVFALSMMLFDRADDDEILKLVVTAVPALGPCQVVGAYLTRDEPCRDGEDPSPELETQLSALAGVDGKVDVPGTAWAWAYPLRAVGEHSGYLVVSAQAEPSADNQFLVRTLAQQAGAALNSAVLYRRERAASEQLRERNLTLASVNQDLRSAVHDLERRARLHELLINVAATGGAEPGIAAALHELTGLAVVIEDKFGNLLGSAGGEQLVPDPRPAARDRTELLNRVRRNGRPMRHRDRILALAQPRDELLGVLALLDPERRAGQYELFALENAAIVLAMELAHQRSLANAELRLRGDLVDDLLTGTDDESAIARSAALGHDLRPPHQIIVVSWPSASSIGKVAQAADRATNKFSQAPALCTRRDGNVVVVAPACDGRAARHDWTRLYRQLIESLPAPHGAVGIGRQCTTPSQLPRSFTEALRALGVRQASANPGGVTTFEDLGFYRMLASSESHREVDEFIREWLGPLIDYDAKHHYDLVPTLWQYYECGGNYDATARALLIHRSTLRYRLRRIRELTGHDLGAVDTRLNLHLATRAWQILHGSN
jgi:sugar diacid utilization regulator